MDPIPWKGTRRRLLASGIAVPFVGMGCARARPAQLLLDRFNVRPEASPQENEQGMRRALAAVDAGGAELLFGPGRYRFAVRYPWTLPANVVLAGAGKGQTILERVDASPSNWLHARNSAGGYAIRDLTALGNGRATNSGDGAFFHAEVDAAAQSAMSDISFAGVELQNFAGDGWIRLVQNGAARHDIRGIRIEGSCSFVSRRSNARGPADLGIWSAAIAIVGNLDDGGAGGRIRDVFVGPVAADIGHIKSLCILWGGVVGARVERPVIERCGTIGIAPNCGAYAIVVGNETMGAPNPDGVEILGPVIKACQSVGVYFVSWGGRGGANRFDGSGGYIANVTDTMNGALPKGAVAATDGATKLTIANVRAVNCVAAVDVPMATGGVLVVDGVDAEGILRNQAAIRIGMQEGFTNTGPAAGITIRNVRVRATEPGVTGIRFDTRFPMGAVRLEGTVDIDVPFIGVSAYREAGRGEVKPFASFGWSGVATIRNATAGAVVLRGNASPIVIDASLEILRGARPGMRDHRLKFDDARNLEVTGTIRIDDVRAGDNPAWDARTTGRAARPRIRQGAVTFTNAVPQLRAMPGSAGVQ